MHNAQGKGVMKEQGQLQNCFLSKALPTTFCREAPEPFFWIQCFSLSLEASGQGEGKGGFGRRGRELSLVLATARGNVFSLKNLNHLQIRQTAQHAHEHTFTCTLVSKQPTATATFPNHLRTPKLPFQRGMPSSSPNPTHPGLQIHLWVISCAHPYRHDPSHLPPNPGMTPSPGP